MSEMVDRVARAIAENQHMSWLYDEAATSLCHKGKLAETRRQLVVAARAAIAAMREPTAHERVDEHGSDRWD